MLEFASQSALARREPCQGLMIGLREITGRGMIDLRGDASAPDFLHTVKSVLAIDLPLKPRTSASWGDIKILWLSTDQWLVLVPQEKVAELQSALKSSLGSLHSLVVDVSDMRSILRLEGGRAREVLLKGTSLDIMGDDYGVGTCRRMRYGEIAALLDVVEADVFDIYVFRSYANYAWDYVQATARKGSETNIPL